MLASVWHCHYLFWFAKFSGLQHAKQLVRHILHHAFWCASRILVVLKNIQLKLNIWRRRVSNCQNQYKWRDGYSIGIRNFKKFVKPLYTTFNLWTWPDWCNHWRPENWQMPCLHRDTNFFVAALSVRVKVVMTGYCCYRRYCSFVALHCFPALYLVFFFCLSFFSSKHIFYPDVSGCCVWSFLRVLTYTLYE